MVESNKHGKVATIINGENANGQPDQRDGKIDDETFECSKILDANNCRMPCALYFIGAVHT